MHQNIRTPVHSSPHHFKFLPSLEPVWSCLAEPGKANLAWGDGNLADRPATLWSSVTASRWQVGGTSAAGHLQSSQP